MLEPARLSLKSLRFLSSQWGPPQSAHVSSIALVVTDPLHCLTKPTKAWGSFAPPICVKAPMRMDSASNPAPKVIAAATWNAFSQR